MEVVKSAATQKSRYWARVSRSLRVFTADFSSFGRELTGSSGKTVHFGVNRGNRGGRESFLH
jgi:hypothetical protein